MWPISEIVELIGMFQSPSHFSFSLRGRVFITKSAAHAIHRNAIVGMDVPLGNDGGYASQDNGSIPNVLRVWAAFRFRQPFANQLGFHCHRL